MVLGNYRMVSLENKIVFSVLQKSVIVYYKLFFDELASTWASIM